MSLKKEYYCSFCEQHQNFSRIASMWVQIGLKTKWTCSVCSNTLVVIENPPSDTT